MNQNSKMYDSGNIGNLFVCLYNVVSHFIFNEQVKENDEPPNTA